MGLAPFNVADTRSFYKDYYTQQRAYSFQRWTRAKRVRDTWFVGNLFWRSMPVLKSAGKAVGNNCCARIWALRGISWKERILACLQKDVAGEQPQPFWGKWVLQTIVARVLNHQKSVCDAKETNGRFGCRYFRIVMLFVYSSWDA